MNSDIYAALIILEKERNIPVNFMLEKIEKSIVTACKSSYGNEDAFIRLGENNDLEAFLNKQIVEEVADIGKEILLADALRINKSAQIGEIIAVPLNTKEFGRIAAQTARNIIRQGIRDGEREQILQEFQSRQKEIVSTIIERIDRLTGNVTVRIGKAESTLVKSEQIGNEKFVEGSHVKVYIVDVLESEKGPRAFISRTHPDFVKKLFETEVPEISEGIIQIKSVARDPGKRTKIAVISNNPEVDPVGSCIGQRGSRVSAVINELGGEKIDIIEYSEDLLEFVSGAIAPAKVIDVTLDPDDSHICHAVVPNDQLSLAIGNKGQNVRLAARLTGFKIDIKPEHEEV